MVKKVKNWQDWHPFILQKMAIGKKRDHINLQKHNPEIILMLLALRANFPFIIFVRFWLFHDCSKNAIWGNSFDKNSVLGTRLLYFLNHCFWTELSVCHSTLCGLALAFLVLWYKWILVVVTLQPVHILGLFLCMVLFLI